MDISKLSKKQKMYYDYVKKRKTPVSVEELGLEMHVLAKHARNVISRILAVGLFKEVMLDNFKGVPRPHYVAVVPPTIEKKPKKEQPVTVGAISVEAPKDEPKVVQVRRRKSLEYPFTEENHDHNMAVAKEALIDYLQLDLKIKIVNPTNQNFNNDRLNEMRKAKVLSMRDWFPLWQCVQNIAFTNPTAYLRTQSQINLVNSTGVL